jgi:hypothetical protein
MIARVKMLGCMFSNRVVAAADVTAGEAESKVHPFHSRLETLFTSLGSSWLNVADCAQMAA